MRVIMQGAIMRHWQIFKPFSNGNGYSDIVKKSKERLGNRRALAVLTAFEKYRMEFWWYRVLKWFGFK